MYLPDEAKQSLQKTVVEEFAQQHHEYSFVEPEGQDEPEQATPVQQYRILSGASVAARACPAVRLPPVTMAASPATILPTEIKNPRRSEGSLN